MKRTIHKYILLVSCILTLSSCAPINPDVQLPANFWQDRHQSVAVMRTKAPEPQLHMGAQQGALYEVIKRAENTSFNKYIEHIDLKWYQELQTRFTEKLQNMNINAKAYKLAINTDKIDYAKVALQVSENRAIIIKLNDIGALRPYIAFIPLDSPFAFCSLTGELVNLNTNKVLWRHTAYVIEPVSGQWDQPPRYKNFNRALNVAINSAQHQLINNFISRGK